jgi:hypothetical protein
LIEKEIWHATNVSTGSENVCLSATTGPTPGTVAPAHIIIPDWRRPDLLAKRPSDNEQRFD